VCPPSCRAPQDYDALLLVDGCSAPDEIPVDIA